MGRAAVVTLRAIDVGSCYCMRPLQSDEEPAADDCCMQAGEELTISYIDVGQPRSARRRALRSSFFFLCACNRSVGNAI